jgi:hypothetical protein
MARDMEEGNIFAQKISPNIMDNGWMDLEMGLDFCNSTSKHIIKVIFKKDWDMEKVRWDTHLEILMRANGVKIKRMDME